MSSLSVRDRTRSPRFPNQTLQDSLRHVESIYAGVHQSPIDSETAFRLMGFSGKTGSSAKALAALRQYGLIEGTGGNTRVTDLAMAILEPESEAEKAQSILNASRSPDVFDSVLARFAQRLPQVDEPIRAFLIRELGFQKNSADDLIRTIRESLAFAEQFTLATEQPANDAIATDEASQPLVQLDEAEKAAPITAKAPNEETTQTATIPLTRDCRAELQIYGPLTAKAVSNLTKAVELLTSVWEEEEEEE